MTEPIGRRERKKQRTREVIQAAALDLFAERGYRQTTIAAIADAADVAIRTVTGHFPTKEDVLFADDPFDPASLATRLDARPADELALDTLRDWMATTMRTLAAEGSKAVWQRRALRARLILADPELRGRSRGAYHQLEVVLAAAVAQDLGQDADALAPRLVALTVVAGLRELYVTHEASATDGAPTTDYVLGLVDDVLAFARAGSGALA